MKYDALLTIDAAAGIHNSKARLIALEDLVDMGVKLEELDLKNSNLLEIEINGAQMNRSSFEGSVLKYSTLNLTQFQKCDFKNVEGSGTKVISANFSFSNFENSNFKQSNFMFSSFKGGSFMGTDFTGANLKGVKFDKAVINGANFSNASIELEELKKAYITKAILPNGDVFEQKMD
ncbi:pentapeptide repeat-containing protein [Flavobacteriaceae bacterium]|nr:pentapeptide repeat-containing protein [Flavobacteriaceae bacterium]